jgi:hypothetical protein
LNNGDIGIVWNVRNRVVGVEIWDTVSDVMDVAGFLVENAKLVLAMILIEIDYGVLC